MKYTELAQKLNEKYNTTAFSSEYTSLDFGERNEADILVNLGTFTINASIDVENLEVRSLYAYSKIDAEKLIRLYELSHRAEEFDEQQNKILDLVRQNSEMSAKAENLKSAEAVIEFAQETILKAIKGENK